MVEETNRRAQLRAKVLLGLLYASFFGLVFVAALYWTFPYDRLRDFVASKLSSGEPGSVTATTVEIGELEPTGISGVHVGDLSITHPTTPDSPPSRLHLDDVTAKVSLLSLLLGNQQIALEATSGKGTLDGNLERNGDGKVVKLELSTLDLGAMSIGSWVGLPLQGQVSGNVDLTIPNDVTKTTGSVNLEINALRVGDGKAKIKPPGLAAGFTLDELDAGKLKLTLDVKDGIATITRLSADGKDVKLNGKGTIRLAEPWKRSRPDLDLDLTFTPAYKNKSDRTKAMFELLAMQPDWQKAVTPEGLMKLHVTGTFGALRGTPGK
ncbi:MAG: hypothetical protein RL701_1654 [Pseudomonadota bacterium]